MTKIKHQGSWSWPLAILTILSGGSILVSKNPQNISKKALPAWRVEAIKDQINAYDELLEALNSNLKLIEERLSWGTMSKDRQAKSEMQLAQLKLKRTRIVEKVNRLRDQIQLE